MTALYIVAGVLLFIALLLACRVRARITYCRELVFTVRYLFLKREYRFAPSDGKEKHVKQTSAATKKEKKKKKKEKEELIRPPLTELVPAVKNAVTRAVKRFGKCLRLDKAKFYCTVASDDPAKTAVLYGGVSAAAGNIYGMLESLKRRKHSAKTIDFRVEPDFIAEKFDLAVDLAASAPAGKLLVFALFAGKDYFKIKNMWLTPEEAEKKKEKEDKE